MTAFDKPDLPVILTRNNWDQKKGVIAKMAVGATGIGDECDKVRTAYTAVRWERLDLETRRREVLQNWKDDSFTKANWIKILKEAADEVGGNLTKLSTALFKLRDECIKAGLEFKKSKTIPSSSTQHVLTMAKTADALGTALSKNSMNAILRDINKEFLDRVTASFIDPMWPGIRSSARQHANVIAELRKDGTAKALNSEGATAFRDMTTGLGNIAKLGERDWGPKHDEARRLFTALTPWADANVIVPGKSSTDVVLAEIDKIEPVFTQALRFVATAK